MTSSATPLYLDDGSSLMTRSIEVDKTIQHRFKEEDVVADFNLIEICKVLNQNDFDRVGLQFPDKLLYLSSSIVQYLKSNCKETFQFFVLADTSYGSCCIDEIAGKHSDCNIIIHFGHTCLSKIDKFKVIYSYGDLSLDEQDLKLKVDGFMTENSLTSIFCFANVHYDACLTRVVEEITEFKCIKDSLPLTQNLTEEGTDLSILTKLVSSGTKVRRGVRYFPNRKTATTEDAEEAEECVIYVGNSDDSELIHTLMARPNLKLYRYDPIKKTLALDHSRINLAVRRRYTLVQKAKDSRVIGIVVGTLGVANYLDVIANLQTKIQQTNRKSYTISVGKLNVAKLANFSEIDVFVLIACPENLFLDSKEYYRPIVTPYELELAILPNPTWNHKVLSDFQDVQDELERIAREVDEGEADENEAEGDEDGYKPHFSLALGKLVDTRTYVTSDPSNELKSGEASLIKTDSNRDLSTNLNSPAGDFLNQRHFKGLEVNLGKTEVVKAQQGRIGIARGYTNEKEEG